MVDLVGQQFGNYRLLRVLGYGASAAVYLGEHQYLERPAAIKVLHAQMELETHEQFRREARTIAQLHHPHIIGVYDFGIEGQTPYLVMEYTPNGTLRSRHPKGIPLPFELIVSYVRQIASALDYAHERHVIHRDIKPENILLNAKHEVLLSDFGLSVVQRTLDPLSTQNPAGTPLYMAPEQIQRKPCAASDQYALGVMVYEWLCGEPPFRGSLYEVFSQHLHDPPPSLCTRLPQLPPAVEAAVFGALAKNPLHRFSTVQDFAATLEAAFLARQPLALSRSIEHGVQDKSAQPLARMSLMPVSSPSKQDSSEDTTQPRIKMTRRIEAEHEQVSSVSPQHALHNQAILEQVRPSLRQTNRLRLLRRVRSFWITGVLEHSLHGAVLMTLGLQEQPDAVANPWHLVLQHPDTAPRPLPAGTRITQVYDEALGELLILGTPGSGKTTLLLELARDLLDRAERDEHHPIPVVFNLSSWAMKRQRLADWLIEELNSKYQVPRKLGQALVNAEQILPLLDGLDEVAPKDRTACIEALNSYRQEDGLLPLVVCSRSADYLAQATRVQLQSAVMVQPLTLQHVDDYLACGGEPLQALRMALHQDASLRELTSTPLMLSILALTYQGRPIENLSGATPHTDRLRQVFEHYVERMLKRRGAATDYTPQQTTHWLAWLARQLAQHNQTEFYMERMQPDWLPQFWRHQPAYRVIVRLGVGLLSGIILGVSIWLALGLFLGTLLGPINGLVGGLGGGLASGLVGGLAIGLISKIEASIQPAEVVVWSWHRLVEINALKRRLIVGISSGLMIGLILGGILIQGDSNPHFFVILIFVLAIAVMGGGAIALASGLTSGVAGTMQDERHLTMPNQGIRRSAWNSIRTGIMGGVVGGIISVMAFGLFLILVHATFRAGLVSLLCFLLLGGSLGGTVSGLIVGLANGGIACIQHIALRFLLWHFKCLPWNYSRFLDSAAERILLCKVGGGYIFHHRLLRDYFASLETPPF